MNWIHVFFFAGSLYVYFPLALTFCGGVAKSIADPAYYMVAQRTFVLPQTWMAVIGCVYLSVLPGLMYEFIRKGYQRGEFASVIHRAQELQTQTSEFRRVKKKILRNARRERA